MVHDPCAFFVYGEARFWQLDEQGLLVEPRLVGHPAGGTVEAEVTNLGSLVQPHRTSSVEVLPGREFRALEEVVPDQAENLLVLALPIGIADSAREGLEAVVTCKVQEAWVPERLSVGSDTPQDRGGHVVEDDALSHTTKVRESVSQPFEQRRLSLVTEESQVEFAREAQEAAEGMDTYDRSADQHSEGRPVDLHLLADCSLEATLGGLCGLTCQARAQLSHLLGQDSAAAVVTQRLDLSVDAADGQMLLDPGLDRIAKRVEFAAARGW